MTQAQRMVPRLFESDSEEEAVESLHGRGRVDLQRIADEIGAPIVPGASESRMKTLIARHHLGIDQGFDERDNLLMEAKRRGIDVKPVDSIDTLRRNVTPAAPRGGTFSVTLPDGRVETRASSKNTYTHAVIAYKTADGRTFPIVHTWTSSPAGAERARRDAERNGFTGAKVVPVGGPGKA